MLMDPMHRKFIMQSLEKLDYVSKSMMKNLLIHGEQEFVAGLYKNQSEVSFF